MGWGEDPAKVRAAQEAEAEAQAAIARRLDVEAERGLRPFERKLLGVLEDLRDAIQSPAAGPVLVTIDPDTSMEVRARIRQVLPPGSLLTGPNGPILDVRPFAGQPAAAADNLLDAPPAVLGRAVESAAMALLPFFADLGGARIAAEAALDAALQSVARHHEPPQQGADTRGGDSRPDAAEGHPAAEGNARVSAPAFSQTSPGPAEGQDGAAGGAPLPPAEHPTG